MSTAHAAVRAAAAAPCARLHAAPAPLARAALLGAPLAPPPVRGAALRPLAARRSPRRRAGAAPPPRAAWGDDVAFAPARVLSNAPVAEGLRRVVLDIGAAAAAAYTAPGQYVQVRAAPDAKPGFFAIASPPSPNDAGAVELLVKGAGGGAAEALCAAAAGAALEASAPMGKGFPVARAPPAECPALVLFATGSGISPVRALIASGALGTRQGGVTLYYGVRSPAHLAFADELAAWEAEHGVKTVTVFSDAGAGYVQDAFVAAGGVAGAGGGAGLAAVLCGQREMAEAVTALLAAGGVPTERILSNF
jgi:ferredoxin-NADP reductase